MAEPGDPMDQPPSPIAEGFEAVPDAAGASSAAGASVPSDSADALDPADRQAAEDDAHLIRRVRWRLVAWSGGTTLLVLLALAVALYATVSSTLATSSVAQLDGRARDLQEFISGQQRTPPDRPPTEVTFGGGSSGTFAFVAGPDGSLFGPRGFTVPAGLPDQSSLAAARSTGRDVRLTSVQGVPVRVLTVTAINPIQGTFLVQVVQDRTAEAQTLQSLLIVLLLGGALALVVAFGFGAVYARRALGPIRESLVAQRAALRRQREFAADASHELRTPLTVIRSSVEHLRRHSAEPVARVGDALEDIDAEVTHLTSMVDDLLLLARSDSGAVSLEAVPVELDDLAADAAASLAAPAKARGVRLVVDPEPAPVSGDPARLRQLVTILVDNAIRHGPHRGTVRVVVRSAGDMATLAVEDEGRGLPPEHVGHVFDRFWRAPGAPAGGTGLGLSIAKWIAERHAGSIGVTSPPEGGVRFEVRLPARPSDPARPSASKIAAPEPDPPPQSGV